MEEIENPPIKITLDDIEEVNKLSLQCPICSNPVYRTYTNPDLAPVECIRCEAIYHRACWELAGGVCAMVGCDETKYRVLVPSSGGKNGSSSPVVKLDEVDIRTGVSDNQRIKYEQRQSESPIFVRFFVWLWNRITE